MIDPGTIKPASPDIAKTLGLASDQADQVVSLFRLCLDNAGVYAESGRYAEAIEAYKQAILINSNHPGSLIGLALLYSTCPHKRFRNSKQAI